MQRVVFISGSTDGIGLETARSLVSLGHHVILHGRSADKLSRVEEELSSLDGSGTVEAVRADLSRLVAVDGLAETLSSGRPLDGVINNAGVYKAPDPLTPDGFDLRFAVNTIAPYRLTKLLLPAMGPEGRVINLSSAAQATVDLRAMAGEVRLPDGAAYAQSKLALTMWSRSMGLALAESGPMVVSVNPGSLLGTKMVKEAFGHVRADVSVGADILVRAALSPEFASASGEYFDNDAGRFAPPHPDALDPALCAEVVATIDRILKDKAVEQEEGR